MKTNLQNFNLDILNSWLDKGLCFGAGNGKDTVCLEQAIALCAGLPLTDKPDSCVAPALSAFGRRINDANWSSDKARSEGVREFAYIQLGTAGIIDETKWRKRLAELTIRGIIPGVLRNTAKINPKYAESLESAAITCENEGTREAALKARTAAAYAADAAYAATAAAATAADAAYAAYAATAAAATAADAAAVLLMMLMMLDAADDADDARDKILSLSVSYAVQATMEQLED